MDSQLVVVPNSLVTERVQRNLGRSGAVSNRFTVGLDYDLPPAQARALLEKVVLQLPFPVRELQPRRSRDRPQSPERPLPPAVLPDPGQRGDLHRPERRPAGDRGGGQPPGGLRPRRGGGARSTCCGGAWRCSRSWRRATPWPCAGWGRARCSAR
ncbi:mechanosensitive ion channel family protein [Microcystis elabens FACHB-917]|nr:mechanosensitive ion channel family protein [Microcystis elabens FACHB-917]